jgi:hypothetical protein
MTPYRDRSQNGDFEPDKTPAQPKDIHYTRDQTTGRKVKPQNTTSATSTTAKTTTTTPKP